MTTYYPIAVDLSKRKVLVVGGGKVALRKVETLLEYGAKVTLVSPQVEPEIRELADGGKITLRIKHYELSDMADATVVIAATDDREVNVKVTRDAEEKNALINVVDVPDLCDFIVPATLKRGDLVIGIWTAGKSPTLAGSIRRKLEADYGEEYSQYIDILGEARELAKSKYAAQKDREAVLKKLLEMDILGMIREGRPEEAREKALRCI